MSEGFRQRASGVRSLLLGPETAFVLVAGAGRDSVRQALALLRERLAGSAHRSRACAQPRAPVAGSGAPPTCAPRRARWASSSRRWPPARAPASRPGRRRGRRWTRPRDTLPSCAATRARPPAAQRHREAARLLGRDPRARGRRPRSRGARAHRRRDLRRRRVPEWRLRMPARDSDPPRGSERPARPPRAPVDAAEALARARTRVAASKRSLAAHALLDAAALRAAGCPPTPAVCWLRGAAAQSLARGWRPIPRRVGSAALGARRSARRGSRALGSARARDAEARAVLRAFLGVRELLWEFGLRRRGERRCARRIRARRRGSRPRLAGPASGAPPAPHPARSRAGLTEKRD